MKKPKPPCETLMPWLRDNLGKHCLNPLTGTDARALKAAVMIAELYCYDRDPSVAKAFGQVVRRMHKDETRELAYHAIAHVREWNDRAVMWAEAGLEPLALVRVCRYEPEWYRRERARAERIVAEVAS